MRAERSIMTKKIEINGKKYTGKSLRHLKWQVEEAHLFAIAERFDAQQKAEEKRFPQVKEEIKIIDDESIKII